MSVLVIGKDDRKTKHAGKKIFSCTNMANSSITTEKKGNSVSYLLYNTGKDQNYNTTSRSDFIEHPLETHEKYQPQQYAKPVGEMNMGTTYSKSFVETRPQETRNEKHETRNEASSAMQNQSKKENHKAMASYETNRENTSKQTVQHLTGSGCQLISEPCSNNRSFRRQNSDYNNPKKVDNHSTNTFLSHKTSFDNETCYRQQFKEHEIMPRRKQTNEQWKTDPSERMDTRTISQLDFTDKGIVRTESFKPVRRYEPSPEAFDSMTTSRSDFKEYPMRPKSPQQTREYVRPEGDMDMKSTYQSNFSEGFKELHVT